MRDIDFEKRFGFDCTLDYIQEHNIRESYIKQNNKDGLKQWQKRHGGEVAFWGKLEYYKRLHGITKAMANE